MNKLSRHSFVFLSIVGLTFSFSAYSKEIRIGVSLPTQRDIGWVRYKQGLEDAAKKSGAKIFIQVADQDASVQASQVDNLLSQKIDILILAPQDAAAAAALVTTAHKAGVKVISLDRLVLNSNLDMYVSFNNVKIGELQGEYIAKNLSKGNIVLLSGAPTDNNSKLLKDGALVHLQPRIKNGNFKVVTEQPITDWQPSVAQKIMENSLTANKNNIQAVIAPNDNTAGAVVQALAAQKLTGKVFVTGQDGELTAAQRIVAGTQSMTVYKDQKKLAAEAIKVAMEMAENKSVNTNGKTNNGKIDVPSVLLAPIVVDKNNLDKEMIQSGLFKKEEVYKYIK
ncbi:substrate-binding domain-containing protein [Silvanigrella paludirubra]|uniref:Substrate-binding domain-containing protein n=1 Tax=Silvanigrella paludirubra TaxID=2499159 RepID=A0A6N6VXC4_9BACT|nr:substrate-binding domain-containing protein [Silvanigrella paludirubra]KAB8039542.1 substrate-binding domain-containing protein [Silvanigrella paludirubra]